MDRKTFEHDLMCLDTLGYEIEHPENSHQYRLVSRPFAFSELKMIIDCLLSARTLDEKTTQRLIKTLKKECSKFEGETLDRQVIVANRVKTTNKVVHYALDEIQTAIQAECQISFKYFDYDMKMKRTYRKNGETYYVSPFVVVYSDENHYLLGYDGDKVRPYRIDRMEKVKAEKALPKQGQEVFDEKIDLDHYRQYTFGMYDGKVETVRLRFFHRMMNTVIDKFGSDVVIDAFPLFLLEIQAERGVFCMYMKDAIAEYGFDCRIRKLSPKTIDCCRKSQGCHPLFHVGVTHWVILLYLQDSWPCLRLLLYYESRII